MAYRFSAHPMVANRNAGYPASQQGRQLPGNASINTTTRCPEQPTSSMSQT